LKPFMTIDPSNNRKHVILFRLTDNVKS